MNFHHIQLFLAVVQFESISVAALNLTMSQPTLSRRIGALEKELGTTLFVRGNKKTLLTPAGKAFLGEAHRLLNDVQHAMSSVKKVGSNRMSIRVGYTPILLHMFIAESLIEFKETHSNVHIELVEDSPSRQKRMVEDGSLDLACIERMRVGELASEKLAKVLFVQFLHAATNQAYKTSDGLIQHRDATFVIPKRDDYPQIEIMVRKLCRLAGFEPRLLEVDSAASVMMMVGLGVGVGLMPAHYSSMKYPGVRCEPLAYIQARYDIIGITRTHTRPYHTKVLMEIMKRKNLVAYKEKPSWYSGQK